MGIRRRARIGLLIAMTAMAVAVLAMPAGADVDAAAGDTPAAVAAHARRTPPPAVDGPATRHGPALPPLLPQVIVAAAVAVGMAAGTGGRRIADAAEGWRRLLRGAPPVVA